MYKNTYTWNYTYSACGSPTMSKSQTPNGHNVERQNVECQNAEWDKTSNGKNVEWDKRPNGTKHRMEKTSNGKNAEGDKRSNGKTPNGTKCRMEKHRMGQNVEWKNIEWDKMSNVKTSNGTKCRMEIRKKNKYFWFFICSFVMCSELSNIGLVVCQLILILSRPSQYCLIHYT